MWNNITHEKAKEIASNFININTTHSYLITSYCYDTILEWLNRNIDDFKTNTIYGTFSKEETGNYSEIFTGTNENRKLKNIYDIVGLDEFTTEYLSSPENKAFPVTRGSQIIYTDITNKKTGGFECHYLFRKVYNIPSSNGHLVFRTILYFE